VVQGVELIDGKPVFYSLGNFMFHRLGSTLVMERPSPSYNWSSMHGEEPRESLVVLLRFGSRGFAGMEVHPVWLDDSWEPVSPDAVTAARILARFATASRELEATVEIAEGVARFGRR